MNFYKRARLLAFIALCLIMVLALFVNWASSSSSSSNGVSPPASKSAPITTPATNPNQPPQRRMF